MPLRPLVTVLPLIAALLLWNSWAAAHPTQPTEGTESGTGATHAPDARERTAYAGLLGQPPVGVVDLGEQTAVAIMATPSGRHQLVYVDWYVKTVYRMPAILEQSLRLSGIRLRGDQIEFHAEDEDAAWLYLWDAEESGPPRWRRVDQHTRAVTYSPDLQANRVAAFYLGDPHAEAKLALAQDALEHLDMEEIAYIDADALILTASDGAKNAVLRWGDGAWHAAGAILGVVNHHAVADLNGDGLVEVLAGDSDVQGKCTRSWSVLYTWNAAKTEVVATPIRADSSSSASGTCDEQPQSCFQEESLTWDVHAKGGPTVELKGTRDTACAGCATGGTQGTRESYVQRYRWNAAKGAFGAVER